MVLHRDVLWLGKQWAVTGYGIQAIDKKFENRFDIEAARIEEEGLAEALRAEPWFDEDDFAEALAAARKRAHEQPLTFRPPPSDEK